MSLLLFGTGGSVAITQVSGIGGGGNVLSIPTTMWGSGGSAPASGDYAVLLWTFEASGTQTPPTGFTALVSLVQGLCKSTIWVRVCDGTESGAIAGWGHSLTSRQTAVLRVHRGTSGVVGTPSSQGGTSSGTTRSNPSHTPAQTGCQPVVCYSERVTSGSSTITSPTTPNAFNAASHSGSSGTGNGGSFSGMAADLASAYTTSAISPGVWTGAGTAAAANVTWTFMLAPAASTPASALPVISQYTGFF